MVEGLQQINGQKRAVKNTEFAIGFGRKGKSGASVSRAWLAIQDGETYNVEVDPRFEELRLGKTQNVVKGENSGCRVLRVNLVNVKRAKWRRVHWGEAYKARRFSG